MLKLMLVDDEPLIIKGLKKIIHWEECGFEVVGIAHNGEDAATLAEKINPHVIVTDVRMPGMDGLELVKVLNLKKIKSKIVILSGYDDFSYVQTALKNGCIDYILKPVKCDEFENILIRLRQMIEDEIEKEIVTSDLKRKLVLSMNAFREKLLTDIVAGKLKSNMEIEEALKQHDIVVHGSFIIMTVEIGNIPDIVELVNHEEKKTMGNVIFDLIDGVLNEKKMGYIFNTHNDKFVVLVTDSEKRINGRFGEYIAIEIRKVINEIMDRTVTIGISPVYKHLDKIAQAYKESEIALKYKLIMGVDTLIYFDIIQHGEKLTFSYPFNIEKGLFHSIQTGDTEECNRVINLLFSNINQYNLISPDYIYMICTELLLMTSRMITEEGGDINKIFKEGIFSIEEIMKNESIGDLRQWFKHIYKQIADYVNVLKKGNTKGIVKDIKHYIEKNYNMEINLNDLANQFYINPSYLSQMFKNETGQNLIDYITFVRILNAKRLLMDKDMKIYEVSIMTGYPDSKYFSQVFKKITGVTPKEFRGELHENEEKH